MPAKHNLLAVILGGGAGKRLFPLTQQRSKPAVPLGGKYRLVDIAISNCINSDVFKMFVPTLYVRCSRTFATGVSIRCSYFPAIISTAWTIANSWPGILKVMRT